MLRGWKVLEPAWILVIFAVSRLGARCYKLARKDFESAASAIPPLQLRRYYSIEASSSLFGAVLTAHRFV